jgi:hypothetical protein
VSPGPISLELDQRAAHGAAPDILGLDHLEAELRQFLRDGVGVVQRLLQLRHVLIGVVADHEREPLRGLSRRGSKEKRQHARNNESEALSAPVTRTDRHAEPSLSL